MLVKIFVFGEDGLKLYIVIIGLFNVKVKNVIVICVILLEKYGGEVLCDCEVLEVLLGVGCKIVNVVFNIVFGELVMVVDMYIFCVVNCIGLVLGRNVCEVEDKLVKVILVEFLFDVYYWLILYGCYVCKVCKLDCLGCVIVDLCWFKDKIMVE